MENDFEYQNNYQYTCMRCGATVVDGSFSLHRRWHDELESQTIRVALEAIRADLTEWTVNS